MSCRADAVKDVLKQITEMHETLQPGQVHDLYHEAYMALLTFQIEDLTEKIGAITTAGERTADCCICGFVCACNLCTDHAVSLFRRWRTLP